MLQSMIRRLKSKKSAYTAYRTIYRKESVRLFEKDLKLRHSVIYAVTAVRFVVATNAR